jgi:3',5'-cyclic AMP phosphodiesterase CpdA
MFKKSCVTIFISLFLVSCEDNEKGIPNEVGNWRVEVGPAGNEFYEPPQISETKPPSEELFQLVRDIAPAYTEIKRWEQEEDDVYFIRAKAGPEEYDFVLTSEAKLVELEYENDSTNVQEEADELVLKGSKESIELNEVPQITLRTLSKVIRDIFPNQAWIASTLAGKRYVIAVGQTIFYARPDGQIQAAGLIEHGALDEIDPPEKNKNQEEIMVEMKEQLGPYRERFNFENQTKKTNRIVTSADGHYRFVVIGDSRSNPDLWFSIVKHIDQLDPRPAFVINTGDIVPHGFTKEYLEYYIPPLLKTDLSYFVAIGNHDDGANGKALEYRYLFGEKALNYFFDYGKTRYIFVDNVSSVSLYKQTLEWLGTVLADTPEGFHIIVAAHKPVATIEKWAYHSWDKENSQVFAELMSKYTVDHVFFGHIHAYSTATLNGIPYTISGGGGAGLHDRFGPLGNVHHYVICDVMADGSMKQKVVRFYKMGDS